MTTRSSTLRTIQREGPQRLRLLLLSILASAPYGLPSSSCDNIVSTTQLPPPVPVLLDDKDVLFRATSFEAVENDARVFCIENDVRTEACARAVAENARAYWRRPPISRVYVIHYAPYAERKRKMNEQLERIGFRDRTTWIEKPDPVDLGLTGDSAALLDAKQSFDATLYDHMRFVREDADDGNLLHHAFFGRPLVPREIAVGMKHYEAWRSFLRDSDDDDDDNTVNALVLEDDVVLHPNFHSQLWLYFNQLPAEDWDLLCLGGAGFGDGFMGKCASIPECRDRKPPGSNVYRKTWKGDGSNVTEIFDLNVMRYADSYVLTRRLARRLVTDFLPLAFPADHQLNYFLNRWDARVFWVQPTLTMQRLHLTESRVGFLTPKSVDDLDAFFATAHAMRPEANFLTDVKRRQGPYLWLCGTFHFVKDYATAERACRRLWEVAPSDHALLRTAWAIWKQQSRLDRVERTTRWLEMAAEHSPGNADIRGMLGLVAIGFDLVAAGRHFDRAIEIAPEVPHFHNAAGVVAAFLSENAIDRSDDVVARTQREAATRHFERALEVQPSFTNASENRRILLENDRRRSYSVGLP